MSFALKRLLGSARMFCSGLSRGVFPFFQVLFGLPFHFLTITPRRRFQFHTRPSRLRQANRDCLFCVRAVLALTDVIHLLPHKLSCLGAGGFPCASIFSCAFYRSFLW